MSFRMVVCKISVFFSVCAVACLFSARPACAQYTDQFSPVDYYISIGAQSWFSAMKGDLTVDGSEFAGTNVDFSGDLGMDGNSNTLSFAAEFRFNEIDGMIISYWNTDYTSRETIDSAVRFENRVFYPGEQVKSTLSMDSFEMIYKGVWYSRTVAERSYVDFGVFGGGVYMQADAMLDSAATNKINESIKLPLPVVGFFGEYNYKNTFFAGMGLYGMAMDVSIIDFTYFTGYANAGWNVTDTFTVSLGYRVMSISSVIDVTDNEQDEFDFSLSGPFAAVSVRF